MRLVALRLITADTLLVKPPHEPTAFVVRMDEPLCDAQLRLLSLAALWRPVMITATMTGPQTACVDTIEAPVPPPPPPPRRRRRPPQPKP